MDDRRLGEHSYSAVIDTALELFAAHGYNAAGATAMQAIARRTGVGRATLYRLFGNHMGLYQAVIALAADRFVGIVASARQATAACEPHERTHTFILQLLSLVRQQPAVWYILTDRPGDSEAGAVLIGAQDRIRAAIIDGALADGRAGRTLTDQQAEWAARFIYGGLAEILRNHVPRASAAEDLALVSFLASEAPSGPAPPR
jgi:AcrR family transcriptional regulator